MTVFGYLILTSIDLYDFISRYSLVLVWNEKIDQTLQIVFDHIAKPLEARQIYSATRRILLFSVSGNVFKHRLSCLIYCLSQLVKSLSTNICSF